jgi:two-component system sensor histidine kinase TctE
MVRLIVPLLAVFCLSSALSYGLARHFTNSIYDAWLRDSADSLGAQVHNGASAQDLNLPESAIELLTFDALDKVYFRVAELRTGFVGGTAQLGDVPSNVITGNNGGFYDTTVFGTPVRVSAVTIDNGKGHIYTVQVAETFKKRERLQNQLMLAFLMPQLILIAIAAVIALRGLSGALAPLKVIENELSARQSARPLPLPEEGVPREIHSVVHSLNELLARIEQLLGTQQRFIADAAHQLRTPLTALKLIANETVEAQTLSETKAAAKRLLDTADKTVRLSNQLLSLARAEQAHLGEHRREPVDLNALAREVGSEWVPRAIDHGVDLELVNSDMPCVVYADVLSLREALSNLLDNALKYGRHGGRIRIIVTSDPDPALAVDDAGPGITPSERDLVTQRFYRSDQISSEGNGLGLAIVKEICNCEKARLKLSESPLGGLRAALVFSTATLPEELVN